MLIAKNEKEIHLLPEMANRHGLIAGSTGSGKSITLQVIAEQFSKMGVPVFLADVKGDLGGIEFPGKPTAKVLERVKKVGIKDFKFEGNPVTNWDVFGLAGQPIKTRVEDMGILLMSRLLDLSEAQEGSLFQIFSIARKYKVDLNDLNDLFTIASAIMDKSEEYEKSFGRISKTSFSALQRNLLTLKADFEDILFGKTSFEVAKSFMVNTEDGRGVINILKAEKLINTPKVYAMFLLFLLTELFNTLPEVGDVDKPKMVMLLDEAHLLFKNIQPVLLEQIEKTVRLIRSKGVSIWLITQNPMDISPSILGQLGNRIQHKMNSFTLNDARAVKAIAQTFRINHKLDVERVIGELKIGTALVSFLDGDGSPTIVQEAMIIPPRSHMGACAKEESTAVEVSEVLPPVLRLAM